MKLLDEVPLRHLKSHLKATKALLLKYIVKDFVYNDACLLCALAKKIAAEPGARYRVYPCTKCTWAIMEGTTCRDWIMSQQADFHKCPLHWYEIQLSLNTTVHAKNVLGERVKMLERWIVALSAAIRRKEERCGE